MNCGLDETIEIEAFRHFASWNDDLARIEMHLKAIRDTAFSVGRAHFSMRAGETIHTENSHKYGPRGARLLLNAGGWMPIREWTDADGMFCLLLDRKSTRLNSSH